MKPESQEIYNKLLDNLDGMVKIYRGLLEVVRKEKEILIEAQLDQLNENNRVKEALLLKSRTQELARIALVDDLRRMEMIRKDEVRLLDLAVHFGGSEGDKLRNMHSVLTLLIKRVQGLNKQNEGLVNSALQSVTGAMNNIKQTLSDKGTYANKGAMKDSSTQPQLVSREA